MGVQSTLTSFSSSSSSSSSFSRALLKTRRPTTQLGMSYLPPGGGGGGGRNDDDSLSDLLPGIGLLAGLALFFFSPLGSIFFAITNSLFVLALLTPFVLYAGFQIWTKLNTVQGQCPSCDQQVMVMKSDGEPSMCFSCGATVRATRDKKGVELCSGTSIDDDFFDTGGGNSNIEDAFADLFTTRSSAENDKKVEDNLKKATRERTVIDVDVDFQDD